MAAPNLRPHAAQHPQPAGPALLRTALPVVAIVVFVAALAAILSAAGSTLGYDYEAYVGAARRLLDGQPLYDAAVDVAGGFAIYLYPPPFAIALVPFALLPDPVALWLWLALLLGAFFAGLALMPVRREVRWAVLLLAGLSWPFLYTMKLGQVTPLLLLACVAGWRWMDRPPALGLAVATGTAVKVQPALLFGWAIVTRRWQAVALGLALLVGVAVLSTLVVGLGAWADYVALLRRVSSPVMTPHTFSPGALAYQAGMAETPASVVHIAWLLGVGAVTLLAWLRRDAATSYVVTVVASQALSPLLWDHYAMLLLIPVALLLERRQWWAAAIPLVTWLPSSWLYPLVFVASLLGSVASGRSTSTARAGTSSASTPA